MEARADPSKMPINLSAKKRKAAFSLRSPATTPLPASSSPSPAPSTPTPTPGPSSEGANLSAALTALKVSLKRDFESLAPPTPAVSPAHGRGLAKRARFDFADCDMAAKPEERAASVSVPKKANALLAVSTRIQFELEKRRRRAHERAPRRRKQLSYFAIVGAFQRAAHERDLAMQLPPLECVVEASTD